MHNRIDARFFRREDRVLVDLGRPVRLLDMDFTTAFAWAKALIRFGEEAQRVAAGHAAMSRREIDRFEESICGRPTLKGDT